MFVRVITDEAMIAFLFVFIQTSSGALNEAPANKSLANYNPEDLLLKTLNINDTESRAGYGLANLEHEQNKEYIDEERNYFNRVKFDDFNENSVQQFNYNTLSYQQGVNSDVTKKRRRRRKPKQSYNGFKYPGPQYYGGVPQNNSPFLAEQHHAPSLASSALSSVTQALSSIAKYDDRQCVARLLCEAAGGALSSSLFERVSGLQPLLTLLAAYSGLSTTPLLVFGRAVLLGASSNTASCRYAHPLCPTDTEELVYYLNNHNGGFFRFFNAPEQEQENLGQFYNQLSQNDLHRPNQYRLYHQDLQQNHRPIPYPNNGYHQYGFAFPYNDNRFKNNDDYRYGDKIQKRIQNKPIIEYSESDNEHTNKLVFPEDFTGNNYYGFSNYVPNNDLSGVKNDEFKFPEDTNRIQNNFRKIRGFSFPENNVEYNYLTKPTNERFVFGNYNKPTYNRFVYNNKYNIFNKERDSNIQTVYVVRGNGDPNRPEIIHLRPGENVHK